MASKSLEAVRPQLVRYMAAVPSDALRTAILGNWTMLAGLIAGNLATAGVASGEVAGSLMAAADAQWLSAAWIHAVKLERACFATARARIAAEVGSVWANDPNFRREYSAHVYRVACALGERVAQPAEVSAPPETLAPRAAGGYSRAAQRRLYPCVRECCPSCESKKHSTPAALPPRTATGVLGTCAACGVAWRC